MTVAIDPDAPWWANLIVVLLCAVIVAAGAAWGVWVSQRPMRRDVSVVKEQVKNTHQTNLREDVDGLHEKVDGALEKISDLLDSATLTQKINTLTRGELRQLRREFDDHVKKSED